MDWIQDRIVYRLHYKELYPIDRIKDCIVYQGLIKKVIIYCCNKKQDIYFKLNFLNI